MTSSIGNGIDIAIEGTSTGKLRPLPCAAFVLSEEFDHRPVECRQVFWASAADPVLVPDHFRIFPNAAGVSNIILYCVVACHLPALHQTG